jgi:cytochrome c-type biogenesis protein CcmH
MIGPVIALILQASAAAEAPLADPALEARAQSLMRELRCTVCENEPVSQSTADMAVDARRKIRQLVEEGRNDSQVRDYFVERYGSFVSFRPSNWLLWSFPFALLAAAGGYMAIRAFAKRRRDLAPVQDDRGDGAA